jgi:hypothetical protein
MSIFNREKLSKKFLEEIKQILNPYFTFVKSNINENSNSNLTVLGNNNNTLIINKDIDEELLLAILDLYLEHIVIIK